MRRQEQRGAIQSSKWQPTRMGKNDPSICGNIVSAHSAPLFHGVRRDTLLAASFNFEIVSYVAKPLLILDLSELPDGCEENHVQHPVELEVVHEVHPRKRHVLHLQGIPVVFQVTVYVHFARVNALMTSTTGRVGQGGVKNSPSASSINVFSAYYRKVFSMASSHIGDRERGFEPALAFQYVSTKLCVDFKSYVFCEGRHASMA